MLLSTLLSTLILAAPISALTSSLTQITNFGPNPRNVSFYLYAPAKVASKPAILVVPHWCHGSAQAAFTGRTYPALADQYGFVTIWPDSPNTVDKCWDVSSNATLSHNGGGDSLGIVSMVKWTLNKYGGDPDRVFVTGTSSGAMMTNVLLGSYPDVFAGGAAFAGVAFGCFAGNGYDVWSDACATGKVVKTGAEWKKIVESAYPSYKGWRPKMQVYHGTNDTTLYPQNLQEEIKEWTAVLNLNSTPTATTLNTPVSGWTKRSWSDATGVRFEAFEAAGVTHDIPDEPATVMDWFDLKCTSGDCFSRPKGRRGYGYGR